MEQRLRQQNLFDSQAEKYLVAQQTSMGSPETASARLEKPEGAEQQLREDSASDFEFNQDDDEDGGLERRGGADLEERFNQEQVLDFRGIDDGAVDDEDDDDDGPFDILQEGDADFMEDFGEDAIV